MMTIPMVCKTEFKQDSSDDSSGSLMRSSRNCRFGVPGADRLGLIFEKKLICVKILIIFYSEYSRSYKQLQTMKNSAPALMTTAMKMMKMKTLLNLMRSRLQVPVQLMRFMTPQFLHFPPEKPAGF